MANGEEDSLLPSTPKRHPPRTPSAIDCIGGEILLVATSRVRFVQPVAAFSPSGITRLGVYTLKKVPSSSANANQGRIMDAVCVIKILKRLGVSGITQDEVQRLVRSSCPLAEWKHEGKGKTTSLAVEISGANELPTYTCSVCGASGLLPDLLDELQNLAGKQYSKASMLVAEALKLKGVPGSTRRRICVDGPPPKVTRTRGVAQPHLGNADLKPFPLLANSDLTDAECLLGWLLDVHGINPQVACRHGLRLHIDPHLKDARVTLACSRSGHELHPGAMGLAPGSRQSPTHPNSRAPDSGAFPDALGPVRCGVRVAE